MTNLGPIAPPTIDPEHDFNIGDINCGREMVLYGSYTSEPCRRLRDIMRRITQRSFGQIAYVYRQFPEANSNIAELAARAAIAAGQQDKFWEMHEALFQRGQSLELSDIQKLASAIGVEDVKFNQDLNSEATNAHIAADHRSAELAGITQVPALLIDGHHYFGSWDEMSILETIEKPFGFRIERASERFFGWAASGGLILGLAVIAALVFVNIGFHPLYDSIRQTSFALALGGSSFALPVQTWINDGLMTIFFLIVGIEIKREILWGELSTVSTALLPLAGALGGMLMPAAIYTTLNWSGPAAHGWGVPMATDIAFTIGIMALLGRRVPNSLRIFVSALAIADDLGAIVIIAVFYGYGLHFSALAGALACFVLMALLNRGRVYQLTPYLALGVLLWIFIHASGLHATLAGVLTAAIIPSRRTANIAEVAAQATIIAEKADNNIAPFAHNTAAAAIGVLEKAIARLREPGHHLQRALEHWTTFLILPLFAFFNTGIIIDGSNFSPFSAESLGVILGLTIGKPLGIIAACYIAVHMGWARFSSEITWLQLLGAGCLAGVGFTMSIFIATAAFSDPQLASVKLATLLASIISAILGGAILSCAGANLDRHTIHN